MEIIPNWHPVFVHFTVALLTVSVVLYIVSFIIKEKGLKEQCCTVARWNLWLGMTVTLFTVLTGWFAYNTVAHDEPSHLAMTDHRNWAFVTAGVFLLLTTWSIFQYRKQITASYGLIIGLVFAFVLLGSTAWRGGEIVYRYGLGVMSLPQVESTGNDGHDHSHGEIKEKIINIKETRNISKKEIPHGEEGHAH